MKVNLKDVTFLIPVKVDSVIRIENLLATVNYIIKNFNTNIIVTEIAKYNNHILGKVLNRNINYIFVEDKDPIFHRTKYLNRFANEVETPFIAIWDADVIIDKRQIMDAVFKLRKDEADIAYPYDGRFYDTSPIIRDLFLIKQRISILHKYANRMFLPYGSNHKGGAFIANTKKYRIAGMENENFYGWGPEDFERYERWYNMGFMISFITGGLYHLTHPRDINGKFNSKRQMQITTAELEKTRKSSSEELIK
ncbi:galactosyltransferase-related protein [Flavobacterium daejeonense]|uniref:galactosyltransferase-related protein n=1 Tax=Flavobacterium daejeonense TaxID=350893 RepID=UPI000558E868|nr:galactosyltransferase-related protein [Flavobacterium daejeonense]